MKKNERECLLDWLVIGVFLCTWLGAGSVSAAELIVPFIYTDGDTLTANSLNSNFDEVETQVTDNANDIDAINNLLSAVKQGSETGNAISSTSQSPADDIASITIMPPANGFVLVIANGDVRFTQTSAAQNIVNLSISTVSAQFDSDHDVQMVLDTSADAANTLQVAWSINRLESATAGTSLTFYVTAFRDANPNTIDASARLTAMFFPMSLP